MNTFQDLYQKLNPQQKLAVDTIEGPVLVVAGPGTGKTQVLAMRIANILLQQDVAPRNILCLTFTESGVVAMRERLFKIIGNAAYYVNITTFHGFANEVIRTFADKFPEFGGQPVQLDDLARIKLITQILQNLPADRSYHLRPFHNPLQYQSEIISQLQTLKREGYTVEELTNAANEQLQDLLANPQTNRRGNIDADYQKEVRFAERNVELAEIYAQYQQLMHQHNFYDYEDMIMSVLEKLANEDEILSHYQENYLYILVDEYQDSNNAQNNLLLQLTRGVEQPNIFAVGDDDQAIYRFQGANVDNMLFFTKQFDNTQIITITQNYRSTQAILDLAMDSIGHNQQRLVNLIPNLDKQLSSNRENHTGLPQVWRVTNGDQEQQLIIREIRRLVESGSTFSDIAILYRRHSDAEDLIDALLKSQIPLKLKIGSNVLQEKPVQRLITILRVISGNSPLTHDLLTEILFYSFIQTQFRFDNLTVYKLVKEFNDSEYFSKSQRQDFYDFLLQKQADSQDSGIQFFLRKLIEWRALASEEKIAHFVSVVMEESGMLAELIDRGSASIEEINAVNSFYSFVVNVQRRNADINLIGLLADLELLTNNGIAIQEQALDTDADGVNLMTVHASKGLEFKHVFVMKVFYGNWGGRSVRNIIKLPPTLFPHIYDKELQTGLGEEDERRLFFVALTRAKESLWVTSAEAYADKQSERRVEQSGFIAEIGTELYHLGMDSDLQTANPQYIKTILSPIPPSETAVTEAYLQSLVKDLQLSPSALNTYIRCPLEFKYERLLRIPKLPNKNIALGNATHFALENLMRALIQDSPLSQEEFIKYFFSSLDRQTLGKTDWLDIRREGKELLEAYYANYHPSWVKPAMVEHVVRNIALEIPGGESVALVGKLDKVEWVDQSLGTAKIVDYKTSRPVSENEIKGLTQSGDGSIWRQLVFYKLMADLDPNFRPRNKLNKFIVNSAEVDFLRPGSTNNAYRKVTVDINQHDVEELKQLITDVVGRIRKLEFGSAEYPLCGECEYCTQL